MTTLAELEAAEKSLPSRFLAASDPVDREKLADLEQERAALPVMKIAAQLAELRAELPEARAEKVAATAARLAEAAESKRLRDERLELDRRIRLHDGVASAADNRELDAKKNEKRIEDRITQLEAQLGHRANEMAANEQRNMIGRNPYQVPGPVFSTQ